eukprot:scaffold22089_cov96-Cyclotella_meneghiniana.AAC.2
MHAGWIGSVPHGDVLMLLVMFSGGIWVVLSLLESLYYYYGKHPLQQSHGGGFQQRMSMVAEATVLVIVVGLRGSRLSIAAS